MKLLILAALLTLTSAETITSSRKIFDVVYHSDGSNSRKVYDVVYHSDGGSSRKIFDVVYHTDAKPHQRETADLYFFKEKGVKCP